MKTNVLPPGAELGKELHNGICQTLTGVHLHLSVIARRLKKGTPASAQDIEELQKLVDQARMELTKVIKQLPHAE